MSRRLQVCPITKRTFHRFNPQTHQCECGKWARGYKPKTVNPNARDRDECQICARTFSMIGGTMGHHGYTRPGCGFIVGDCMGVGHKPFPATDALVKYRAALVGMHVRERELMELYATEERGLGYDYSTGYGRNRQTYHLTILAAAKESTSFIKGGSFISIPSFEQRREQLIRQCSAKISSILSEIRRVDERIESASK